MIMIINTTNKGKSPSELKRNSRKKEDILSLMLSGRLDHPTADEVCAAMRKRFPSVSLATVYRNLNTLSDEGKLRKIDSPDSPTRFDFTTHSHAHIVCQNCGRVFDAISVADKKIFKQIPDGFNVESINISASGICADCQKRAAKNFQKKSRTKKGK